MDPLHTVLAHRGWLRVSDPFPHIIARDVFTPDFYDQLAGQMSDLLARGLSERPARMQFSRNIPGYDSYGIGFGRGTDGAPIQIFTSACWRDLISRLFGISPTPYVFAGAHHHGVGSRSGFIHNDLNPVWFPRADRDEIRTPDPERCSYKTGTGSLANSQKVQVVRGAAVIFFLLNNGWRAGDGGETGLYETSSDDVQRPCSRCPPIDNSLLAFECTPNSFHTYLSNQRLPRTSIIMWVHRTFEDAVAKFGEKRLERWQS